MSGYYPPLPCVMLTKGNTQTVPTSTTTELTWVTEEHDPMGTHAASSTDVIIPVTGKYLALLLVVWAADSGGTYRQAGFLKNGVSLGSEVVTGGNTTDFSTYVPRRLVLDLVKGDVMSAFAIHSRGSNTSVAAASHMAFIMLSKAGS
jgi:hypothetical protein